MTVVIDGTNGVTTPGVTNTAGETIATTLVVTGAATAGSLQVGGVATNLYPLVSGTAVTPTTQTSVDFTGIPSTAKRITVMFSGLSTNGSSAVIIQLGDSGGVETTGYVSGYTVINSGTGQGTLTTGLSLGFGGSGSATYLRTGHVFITLVSTNVWVSSGFSAYDTSVGAGASVYGSKTLSDTLDRVRITTVNGTDTFDAGTINILWE